MGDGLDRTSVTRATRGYAVRMVARSSRDARSDRGCLSVVWVKGCLEGDDEGMTVLTYNSLPCSRRPLGSAN